MHLLITKTIYCHVQVHWLVCMCVLTTTSMRKSSLRKNSDKEGCQKGLKQVGDVHRNACLHPYFALMCNSTTYHFQTYGLIGNGIILMYFSILTVHAHDSCKASYRSMQKKQNKRWATLLYIIVHHHDKRTFFVSVCRCNCIVYIKFIATTFSYCSNLNNYLIVTQMYNSTDTLENL